MRGYKLVALIFAREVSDSLTSLVKTIDRQLDEASARRPGSDRLGVFVVFSDEGALKRQRVQDLVAREKLKQVVLSTDLNASGFSKYRVAGEADLTVVIYEDSDCVSANFPLKKWELNETKAEGILKALTRVLPRM